MALASYSDLLASISSWLARDDVATVAPDFIKLAEEQISGDLSELPVMQTKTTVVVAQGATSIDLPTDCFVLLSARIVSLDQKLDITTEAELERGPTNVTGVPSCIAIDGSGSTGKLTARPWPIPDAAYTLQILYSKAVPALSATEGSTTNFVMTRAPSLYLYGSLLAAEPFVGRDARMPLWQAKYDEALLRFRGQKWGGATTLPTDLPRAGSTFDITRGW